MAKFRHKPTEIDAVQWAGGINAIPKLTDLGLEVKINRGRVELKTLEGTMFADARDWIIKGVKGEFYPCKPDIFAENYEAVE